jgi:hypothetical protein
MFAVEIKDGFKNYNGKNHNNQMVLNGINMTVRFGEM